MRSDSVLKLGERIIDEFGLDQTVDTLGRWMAHYIAEKISDVEAATGKARDLKMSACADAILKFWAHRSELPSGKRPFEDFELIFRALQSLNPDDATPRYFLQIMSAVDKDDESSETGDWLSHAARIDRTASLLIRYCLSVAAEAAIDKSKEWVALASDAGKGGDLDVQVIRILIHDAENLSPKSPEDLNRKKIEDLVERLEGFAETANKLSAHFSSILQTKEDDRGQV
jgi:hypothetical protein